MKLRLHHVNVVSDDIKELHRFYAEVLGLATVPLPMMAFGDEKDRAEESEGAQDDDGDSSEAVGVFEAGGDELQIHAGRRQAYLGPRMGQSVNPLLTGHFAFRTDDLDEVRKQLTDTGVPFSDYGEWSVKDWDQIFLTDPAGNVIEIHQVLR